MTVLSRLLRKIKPKVKTLEQKIEDLNTLSGQDVAAVADSESSEGSLRIAAISLLSYGSSLKNLAFQSSNPSVQLKAKDRIAHLIEDDSVSFKQFCTDRPDVIEQLSVLGFCKRTDFLHDIINDSTDETLLFNIAQDGVSVKTRQMAADKISDQSQLKRLLKITKSKDKVVYKIVKEKLQEIQRAEKESSEHTAAAEMLCRQLEKHGKRGFDKAFIAQLDVLRSRWILYSETSLPELKERVEHALVRCQEKVDGHLEEIDRIDANEKAAADAQSSQQEILSSLKELLASVFEIIDVSEENKKTVSEKVERLQERWCESEQYRTASVADTKVLADTVGGIDFQLEQLALHGSLVSQFGDLKAKEHANTNHQRLEVLEGDKVNDNDKVNDIIYGLLKVRLKASSLLGGNRPQIVEDVSAWLKTRETTKAARAAEIRGVVRHVSGLIAKANSALSNGRSNQSAGIRRSIEQKLAGMGSVPVHVVNQLAELDDSLAKLLDWKSFVIEPKKHMLIEQMQHLLHSQSNPEALAVKIKRLQDEWKDLSKGGHDHDQVLWDKFHQLAQDAYEPCKIYFSEKALARQSNLEKREKLVGQLGEYIDSFHWGAERPLSAGADPLEPTPIIEWSKVEKVLATAVSEWRSYSPTDRQATKVIQQKFDQNLDLIRQNLNGEYERNSAEKRLLIEKASLCVDLEDSRKAIDEVKLLQGLWKKVGVTARREDNILWREFRAVCDTVFEKRKKQAEEFKADLDSNKKGVIVLCEEVDQLAKQSGQALLDAMVRIKFIREEFSNIDQLPRAESGQLKARFSQSIETFDASVLAQRLEEKKAVWVNLLEASDKIRLFQLACLENRDSEITGDIRTDAREFVDRTSNWPKNGLTIIENKFSADPAAATLDENERALRMLCIRSEILCDMPSPQEDQPLRLDYQVKRLEKGLGQNSKEIKPQLNSLLLEWASVGPVVTERYSGLIDRLNKCRELLVN